jgi:hypothetical protein
MIKKLAAFEVFTPVYNCETATIETHTLATPIAYNVQYTLPNPQAVLEFSLHKDSVGVASGDPVKCGLKTYTTDQSWATVLTPADPVNGVYKLMVDTNKYDPLTHTISIKVNFSNTSYTNSIT